MKKYLLMLFALLSALAAQSCGPAADGKQEVFWMGRGTPAEMELWQRIKNDFEAEHKDIKVRLEHVPYQQYESKFQTMMAAGTPPDVIFIGPPKFNDLVRLGALEPLDDLVSADPSFDRKSFYPYVLNTYVVGDKLYGLPNDACIFAVFYNKELFDRQGLPYPKKGWTWQDFVATARALSKQDGGSGRIYGCIFGGYETWMWQNGGDYFDNNANPKKSVFLSSANRQTFQFLHDLIYKYGAAPKPNDDSIGSWFDAFKAGQIAMYITGHWEFPQLRQVSGLRWDTVELPRGRFRANYAGGSCFCIPAHSKNKKAAFTLIKYLTAEKAQKVLLEGGFSTPALRTPDFTKAFLSAAENNAAFLDVMDCIKTPLLLPGGSELKTLIQEKIDLYWLDKITLDQMLESVDGLLKDYLRQNPPANP